MLPTVLQSNPFGGVFGRSNLLTLDGVPSSEKDCSSSIAALRQKAREYGNNLHLYAYHH